MRWRPPSERVQMVLLSPILIPIVAVAAVFFLPAVPFMWTAKRFEEWRVKQGWREWFAWRPVKFNGFFYDEEDCWFWLERVERRRWNGWEYRPIGRRARWERAHPSQGAQS